MNNRNCACQKLAKLYITSQATLKQMLMMTAALVEKGDFILAGNFDDNYCIRREFKCAVCGQMYALTAESIDGITGRFGKKSAIRSVHIRNIELLCEQNMIKETYRGPHLYESSKTGEWVYFDCWFYEDKIRQRFNLPATVKYYEYDGRVAGQESGFVDELTDDAVLGNHPLYAKGRNLPRLG